MTDTYHIPRCEIRPLPEHQAVFLVDNVEKTRWHFGAEYPRPFFYPLNGPSGNSLTRMGHPGAPNHDHHRSVWFAHNKVLGMDFWADGSHLQIRQHQWLAYQDGDLESVMASELGWYDGHDPQPLMKQVLVAALQPDKDGQYQLELQATFIPTAATLELQQTNFGMLAVRVARNISSYFGGGILTNSAGSVGEPAIFGKPAKWMDYSGPVRHGKTTATEGVTFLDHPGNPGQPTHWHVREDGWMGASLCFTAPIMLRRESPLTIRYLLDIHSGPVAPDRASRLYTLFAKRPALKVFKGGKKHTSYTVQRVTT